MDMEDKHDELYLATFQPVPRLPLYIEIQTPDSISEGFS